MLPKVCKVGGIFSIFTAKKVKTIYTRLGACSCRAKVCEKNIAKSRASLRLVRLKTHIEAKLQLRDHVFYHVSLSVQINNYYCNHI